MGLEKDRCVEDMKKTVRTKTYMLRSNVKAKYSNLTILSLKTTIVFDHYVSFSVSVMVMALLESRVGFSHLGLFNPGLSNPGFTLFNF